VSWIVRVELKELAGGGWRDCVCSVCQEIIENCRFIVKNTKANAFITIGSNKKWYVNEFSLGYESTGVCSKKVTIRCQLEIHSMSSKHLFNARA
jgi:hypothetical protein